jgi:uncharacterized protein YaiI (UPF0178 family)
MAAPRAHVLAELLDQTVEAGGTVVDYNGRRYRIEQIADMAEHAVTMAEKME